MSAGTQFAMRSGVIKRKVTIGILCAAATLSQSTRAESVCPSDLYDGFDSRLKPLLITTLIKREHGIAHFAMRRGHPLFLTRQRLLVGNARGGWAAVPILEGTRGMVLTRDGEIEIATGAQITVVDNMGRRATGQIGEDVIVRTGRRAVPKAVEVFKKDGGRFSITTLAGPAQQIDIVSLDSEPSAIGWNSAGLSFVAHNTLWTWLSDTRELRPLITDQGVATARATCLLPDGRAVVGLQNITLVVSDSHAVTLAGFGSFCDVDGEKVAIFDPDAGIIWEVDQLGEVGLQQADIQYARRLLDGKAMPQKPDRDRVAEAMRIVGCPTIQKWKAGLPASASGR